MIHCISRRAESEGEEGSYEGHLSFMEGLKNRLVTCLRKTEPLRDVQRLERRRLGKICHKVGISRVCSEQ
jgi:hypothetical protein